MRLTLALLLGAALATPASAQYSLEWRTVDGGGGRASGGAYELSGTLGQPDADLVPQCSADGGAGCAGAAYVLGGGFWAGLVGAPALACGPALECIFRDGFETAP